MEHTKTSLLQLILRILSFKDVSNQFATTKFFIAHAASLNGTANLSETIGFYNLYFTHYKAQGTDSERSQAAACLKDIRLMRSQLKRKQVGTQGTNSANLQTVANVWL